jgi:hypothetical protein
LDVDGSEEVMAMDESVSGSLLLGIVVARRARLGGGHPETSSSELDDDEEASIAKRLVKNDSWGTR